MPSLPADRVEVIEALVTDWLHDEDVPGASVVVVDADGERYAGGFGARDLEENAPATPDTRYGLGSISKAVTSLAVFQLEEAGQLSVDDPVDDYVDHYADAPGDPITIGELLSHTSGMPATPAGLLAQHLTGHPAGVATEADRERFVRDSTGERATDRERFMYYNTGYDVLGAVVEAVDGRPYDDYVREEVFEPLGMDRAGFELAADEEAMTPYEPGEGDDPPEAVPFPTDRLMHPAGGLVASPRAFGRFLRAMMTDGSLEGGRVCEPATRERLQRGRVVRQRFLDGSAERYGYGWMRQTVGDDVAVGHGGNVLVSTAYAGFLEEAGLGVVVATNTAPGLHPVDVGRAILALATGGSATDVPAIALREKFETVTGTYESFRGGVTATVERDGGTLAITFSGDLGEQELTAFPETLDPADHTFTTVTVAGARPAVEFDASGETVDLFFQRDRLRRTGPV